MPKKKFLRLPVLSEGAEYLVMGYLMRRNILTYKAPPGNEGYDLICIHPDPRHRLVEGQQAQVRVQVKSRYQTDCDRGFPVKETSLEAFDFLVVVFQNIGEFYGGRDGTTGARAPEFYTLSADFIRAHHQKSGGWQKVMLRGLEDEIEPYKNEAGFELIANALGVPRPTRPSAEQDEQPDNTTAGAGADEPRSRPTKRALVRAHVRDILAGEVELDGRRHTEAAPFSRRDVRVSLRENAGLGNVKITMWLFDEHEFEGKFIKTIGRGVT